MGGVGPFDARAAVYFYESIVDLIEVGGGDGIWVLSVGLASIFVVEIVCENGIQVAAVVLLVFIQNCALVLVPLIHQKFINEIRLRDVNRLFLKEALFARIELRVQLRFLITAVQIHYSYA